MSFYVNEPNAKPSGPWQAEALAQAIFEGRIHPNTFVVPVGEQNWTPLHQRSDVMQLVSAIAAPRPSAPPSIAPVPAAPAPPAPTPATTNGHPPAASVAPPKPAPAATPAPAKAAAAAPATTSAAPSTSAAKPAPTAASPAAAAPTKPATAAAAPAAAKPAAPPLTDPKGMMFGGMIFAVFGAITMLQLLYVAVRSDEPTAPKKAQVVKSP